jgi:hypothetical protein
MRSRTFAVAGVTAAALAAATAFAGTASAHNTGGAAVTQHAVSQTAVAKVDAKACYTNNDPSGDTGIGVTSANYSDDSTLDTQGAADFTVKKKCVISKVTTTGIYYNGSGPATDVNVIFYKNKKGVPGAVVKEYDNLKYTDSTGTGALAVKIKKTTLKKGKYFVTVAANMTLGSGGQWGWELTSNQKGAIDQWENQGGGFGVCPTWDDILTCVGFGNDFMVTLS